MRQVSDHEGAVARKADSLRTTNLRVLETAVIEKRLQWCQDHVDALDGSSATPRLGYETLLFRYLGLSEDDVPVVSESDTEITWLSRNACPTLDACTQLNLATASVCRSVYEKPTQALLSCLAPELRFVRHYTEMRPDHPHCKETILRLDFGEMMSLALAEARESRATGNKGYGAVVVLGDRVLSAAYDTVATVGDPSLHAEMNAIRGAVAAVGDSNLCGAVLFSTCEPCPMCSALAVWANVTTIVFGASIEQTVQLGKSRIQVSAAEIIERSPGWTEVIGGVMAEDCLDLCMQAR
jgi:tRNA(Arg) A34 adenosine deaminase TadA